MTGSGYRIQTTETETQRQVVITKVELIADGTDTCQIYTPSVRRREEKPSETIT